MARNVGTVAVIKDNKVLILRRSPEVRGRGFWNFPGGSVEEGETPREGAARELQEEAGLEVSPDTLEDLGVLHKNGLTIHFFITDDFSGDVVLNEESDKYEWIDLDEASDYLFVGGGVLEPQIVSEIKKFLGD